MRDEEIKAQEEVKTQLEGMKKLLEMSRTRTDMAAERNYQNAERTLSVWVRTALATMVFGIAVDRLGLMAYQIPKHAGAHFTTPDAPSMLIGVLLVLFSILMALISGIRFVAYAREYRKQYSLPAHHNEWQPMIASFLVAIFGAALLVFMIWFG